MNITVSGRNIDVGDSLRTHIEARLAEGVSKYLDRVTNIGVVVSKEGPFFRIDITGNTGTHAGMVIKGRSEADDVYAAFDSAADKIEKQLRRYKRRITNHHKESGADRNMNAERAFKAKKYVLNDQAEEAEEKPEVNSLVIAEKTTDIETLTVSEAVMRMDLADLPALLFVNSAHGRVNVVYRRADGNISWVDPQELAA